MGLGKHCNAKDIKQIIGFGEPFIAPPTQQLPLPPTKQQPVSMGPVGKLAPIRRPPYYNPKR